MNDFLNQSLNQRLSMNGLKLLAKLPPKCASVVFLDPQYRQVLDKMNYGNEGERQQGRAALPQMSDPMVRDFLVGIERVLKPSGHLFLWMDKFSSASAHWRRWLPDASGLALVDSMIWNSGKFGMGKRLRRRYEVMMILQAPPKRTSNWTNHGIPDVWFEYADQDVHPHAKPIQLTQTLIRAVTKSGDLVVDPAAGSFGVLDCCLETKRKFIGCDLAHSA